VPRRVQKVSLRTGVAAAPAMMQRASPGERCASARTVVSEVVAAVAQLP